MFCTPADVGRANIHKQTKGATNGYARVGTRGAQIRREYE